MNSQSPTARAPRVPLHRSLVGRLLATSVLIAVASVTATAWLATQSTTRAIHQEQSRSLADDKRVYDLLIGYAATHRDWSGVSALLRGVGPDAGRRITVTTEQRELIAQSAAGGSVATARPFVRVDPLHVDQALSGRTGTIDARVIGPYQLTPAESANSRKQLQWQLTCMHEAGVEGRVTSGDFGQPVVLAVGPDPQQVAAGCGKKLQQALGAQKAALRSLSLSTQACLGLGKSSSLSINQDFTVRSLQASAADRSRDLSPPTVAACVHEARIQQMRSYVAPPALLFITDTDSGQEQPVFRLSRSGAARIVWVSGGVLLATIVLTVVTGRRLVRPLQALTEAAMTPSERPAPMPVTGQDEIAHLARALNDLAERRDRAEEQRRLLVSDVAHELRNPLTNIRAWLEAAQDDVVAINHALVDLLQDEAAVLHHVVDDLADLAAADAGSLRLHQEPVYLRDVLEQVCDLHQGPAQKRQIMLTAQLTDDPLMNVDPVRLRQIVSNLLSNAIRYTPAGGRITMSMTVVDAVPTITVADTGVGIAADDLPRIFDRFWRADSSRTRATGGSGLGLPIARKLAEAHGGSLTAHSRVGEGTAMTLRLPFSA